MGAIASDVDKGAESAGTTLRPVQVNLYKGGRMKIKGRSIPLLCTMAICSGNALAQDYMTRPITLVVPTTAGGASDLEARMYARVIQANTGQQFLVESKAGGGGRVGYVHVARAAPDGLTLLMMTSSFTAAPALIKKLDYDPIKDFEPVTLMGKRKTVLFARANFPANNITEYIAYAKANPGKINFGTAGLGNMTHLAGAWMHIATISKATFVHYKGIAMYPDMLADRVDVAMDTATGAGIPLFKAGKLKILGVSSLTRAPQLPNVPTIAEQINMPDFEYPSWLGVAAPGKTPQNIMARLNTEFVKVTKNPEVIKKTLEDGGELIGNSAEDFRKIVASEIARWPKIVKEIGFELGD